MIWIGLLILVLTFAAIIKRYETRMVLFFSGLTMAIISGQPLKAFDSFTAAMINTSLVPIICTVMGFAYVMKATKCDMHLVQLLAGSIKKASSLLIPGTVIVTFFINIAIPSAAGCAAAVGAILIPTLIKAGVHPAIAGSAVLAGTWGSTLSPGGTHNPFVAKLANVDVMTVIATELPAVLTAALVVAVVLTGIAFIRKEHKSIEVELLDTIGDANAGETNQVSYLKAIIPLVPLVVLILSSKQVGILPPVSIPLAMIVGAILGFLVTFKNPQDLTKQFFSGMGEAYGSIIGIIVAAAVFTSGMELIGLTKALIDVMKGSEQIARVAAGVGPLVIAVLCGSGDAAALAFNGAITPHAAQFGLGIIEMGSTAQVVGALGRSMSPVAGATIVCAQLAGVSTLDITKRNALPMILAAITMILMLLW